MPVIAPFSRPLAADGVLTGLKEAGSTNGGWRTIDEWSAKQGIREMKCGRLVDLNFRNLLHYGGQPPVQNAYNPPIPCTGYCVDCEEKHLVPEGWQLDQMSHACDTTDFEALLGPLPLDGRPIMDRRIMFLLEKPGGDYENGAAVPYLDFQKRPPVNHYYWTPNVAVWPVNVAEFGGNFYGSYFAYLMRRFRMRNVYITNSVKCAWRMAPPGGQAGAKAPTFSPVTENCTNRWLSNEVALCPPVVSFCFGRRAKDHAARLKNLGATVGLIRYLWHPSAIQLSQRYKKTREEMVAENDHWIEETLSESV